MPAIIISRETATTATETQAHGVQCKSASCTSHHKIWRSIQAMLKDDDKKGLIELCRDAHRVEGVKKAILTSRVPNDPRQFSPSRKHGVLQFDKTLYPEAEQVLGKTMTDLSSIQVAILYQREAMACHMLAFLHRVCQGQELQVLVNHVAGGSNSALHFAAVAAMPRLVRLLLDMGADPMAVNAHHLTTIGCCRDADCLALLKTAVPATMETKKRHVDKPASAQRKRGVFKSGAPADKFAIQAPAVQDHSAKRQGVSSDGPLSSATDSALVASLPCATVPVENEPGQRVPGDTGNKRTHDMPGDTNQAPAAVHAVLPASQGFQSSKHAHSNNVTAAVMDAWFDDDCLSPCLDGLLLDVSRDDMSTAPESHCGAPDATGKTAVSKDPRDVIPEDFGAFEAREDHATASGGASGSSDSPSKPSGTPSHDHGECKMATQDWARDVSSPPDRFETFSKTGQATASSGMDDRKGSRMAKGHGNATCHLGSNAGGTRDVHLVTSHCASTDMPASSEACHTAGHGIGGVTKSCTSHWAASDDTGFQDHSLETWNPTGHDTRGSQDLGEEMHAALPGFGDRSLETCGGQKHGTRGVFVSQKTTGRAMVPGTSGPSKRSMETPCLSEHDTGKSSNRCAAVNSTASDSHESGHVTGGMQVLGMASHAGLRGTNGHSMDTCHASGRDTGGAFESCADKDGTMSPTTPGSTDRLMETRCKFKHDEGGSSNLGVATNPTMPGFHVSSLETRRGSDHPTGGTSGDGSVTRQDMQPDSFGSTGRLSEMLSKPGRALAWSQSQYGLSCFKGSWDGFLLARQHSTPHQGYHSLDPSSSYPHTSSNVGGNSGGMHIPWLLPLEKTSDPLRHSIPATHPRHGEGPWRPGHNTDWGRTPPPLPASLFLWPNTNWSSGRGEPTATFCKHAAKTPPGADHTIGFRHLSLHQQRLVC